MRRWARMTLNKRNERETQTKSEPSKVLDAGKCVPHIDCRRQVEDFHAMSDFVAYVDGGSLGNPGSAGIGVVMDGSAAGPIRIARWIGRQDNNVAEYVALLEALQCAKELKARALHVFSDSEVVVRQMSGEYRCRSPRLYSLNWICRKLAGSFAFTISHVSRENNREANRLASSAARNGAGKRRNSESWA
jgi:ribonuclease HI